jgi:hypothetical protein
MRHAIAELLKATADLMAPKEAKARLDGELCGAASAALVEAAGRVSPSARPVIQYEPVGLNMPGGIVAICFHGSWRR